MENEYKDWSRECLEEELRKYKKTVDMFANTVLGGVARMSLNDMSIIEATDGYYRMTGYSRKESMDPPFSNCGLNLMIPEDMESIQRAIEDLRCGNKSVRIEYRIRKKNGEVVWNAAFCSGVQGEESNPYIDVFFLDINQEREQQRQNILNEERFRIISEQTKDVIFEWNIEDDTLHYSSVFEKVYGCNPPKSTKELAESNLCYEEDKPIMKQIIEDMRNNMPYAEFKVRLRLADGSYYWALHRATLICDENSVPSRVIGIVSNVTEFVENALDLQHKAEHDALTGLVNRVAAQKMIEQRIQWLNGNTQCAFIQFDVDHFKQINDFMGHAAGDMALQTISLKMQKMFRKDDLLVRMGGDEFSVFLTGYGNRKSLEKRVGQFLQTVCSDFRYEEKIYPLSISIGIALYPEDGQTFQELYENADVALYRAKRKGGNKLEFF